ncbi:C6orf115 protein [Gonapodya prolifera JEL478]|uniref:C6orf115 protein n=1 Tax=Gonapodya prolifera (strain JEL478) TaxID=1344416 RepID=A0A139AT62_GONPJ|nr:C6orf115 protein [Gonapodya prolifera JEL478]|eukprot:KXS19922.1 C6orf115 protein [Gonapodya prolifera JEL478]
MKVEEEIELLISEIKRLGTKDANGIVSVKYGKLFSDDKVANTFEALLGTLRAAKKRKIVDFKGEMLLQGVHDDVVVILLKETL